MKRIIICRCITILTIMAVLWCTLCGCGNGSKKLTDGSYKADVTMEGGTGKAKILSPVQIDVVKSNATATLIWSSSNYDYMIVDGVKYINEASGGGSTFTIPIENPPSSMVVIGDTTAMSVPHEIEYTITFEMIE